MLTKAIAKDIMTDFVFSSTYIKIRVKKNKCKLVLIILRDRMELKLLLNKLVSITYQYLMFEMKRLFCIGSKSIRKMNDTRIADQTGSKIFTFTVIHIQYF